MSRPRQQIARMPFRVAVALIALWVALSPQAPETNAQSTITVDFDRIVLFDRGGSFLFYRDYNVQEGATLRPIIKFSAATPADATFSVVAEAGTATATATVDFPAGIHTFTVPAGSIRHSFEIPIPWDAEIEDYETFIRNRPDDHPWHPDIEMYADTFRVLGCTSTEQGGGCLAHSNRRDHPVTTSEPAWPHTLYHADLLGERRTGRTALQQFLDRRLGTCQLACESAQRRRPSGRHHAGRQWRLPGLA